LSTVIGREDAEAYLLGLTVGRGIRFRSENRLLIEFPHKNATVPGISHCEKCGWLATGFGKMKCKNPGCGRQVPASTKRVYEQPLATQASLKTEVIPFLHLIPDLTLRIGTGSTSTHLAIDFGKKNETWASFCEELDLGDSFHSFGLPKSIHEWPTSQKVEFINGLMDTAGFANSGGWLPRDGEHGHGRMRFYFQIVRNWRLAVEIDNFLRTEFDTPIQTIDWGHPNIRSANGQEACVVFEAIQIADPHGQIY